MKQYAALAIILCLMFPAANKKGVYDNMAFPTGIRLSNPGNIKKDVHNDWRGMPKLQEHPKFVRFNTPYDGIRALCRVLVNYKRLHAVDTLGETIVRYAPPSENHTNSYINDVSKRTGFFPNEPLDLEDVDVLVKMAKAIAIHENGVAPAIFPLAWYEDEIYYEAAYSALEDS